MGVWTKEFLSGCTNGLPILISASSSPGDTVHQAIADTNSADFLYLFCSNPDSSDHLVTVQWGGVTSPDDVFVLTVPSRVGLVPLCKGLPLNNSVLAKVFADSGSKVNITGFVLRRTGA